MGPAIKAAGPIVTAPEGYPFNWLAARTRSLGVAAACATPDDARRTARSLAEQGMDFVKVAVMHRGYADQPLAAIDLPVAAALVDEAHRLGLKVLAHAHRNDDYRLALAAGVDALMHSSFDPLDAELVERVVDAGVVVCPTLWVFESVCIGAEERWDWSEPSLERSRPPEGPPRAAVTAWPRS